MELITFFLVCMALVVIWVERRRSNARTTRLENRLRRLESTLNRLDTQRNPPLNPSADSPSPRPIPSNIPPSKEPTPSARAPAPLSQPNPEATPTPTPAAAPLMNQPAGTRSSPVPPEVLSAPPPFTTSGNLPPAMRPSASFNWEQFMGVKLFAWLGGLALFLAVCYFIKYSIERDLIPPALRVALGFLTGLALVGGGELLSRRRYPVTAQTLCGTGLVILYAATYASRVVYAFAFFSPLRGFLLMTAITAAAFLQAVRLRAPAVAVLGLAGGFLTPVLLSTGQDHPVALFSYVALLDAGLLAVVLRRHWDYLSFLAALGSAATAIGWVAKFFEPEKVYIAFIVFLGLDLLFLLGAVLLARQNRLGLWTQASLAMLALLTMAFTWHLLPDPAFSMRPVLLFAFILGGDLCLLALVILVPRLYVLHLTGGGVSFATLAIWVWGWMDGSLLHIALGFCLGFAVLHAVFPILLQWWRPNAAPSWWAHLSPLITLLILVLPLGRVATPTLVFWPAVLLLDLVAVALAWLTASAFSLLGAMLLTTLLTASWIMQKTETPPRLLEWLCLIGVFAALFLIASLLVCRRVQSGLRTGTKTLFVSTQLPQWLAVPRKWHQETLAFCAVPPFLLMVLITDRLPLPDPSSLFALGLLLVGLVLVLTRLTPMTWLPLVGLGSIGLVEWAWHTHHFVGSAQATTPLAWYLGFYLIFALFPFLGLRKDTQASAPWIASALSGPLHFWLVYDGVNQAWPNDFMGLIPLAFALPTLAGLEWLRRTLPPENNRRMTRLAWFGGVTLLFVSLIFPIQWEHEWLTLSWALEGTALLWLFHRVPHPGLKVTGVAFLLVAFVRLALNPAVLSYHPRGSWPIWNWYLYAYGIVTLCLFAAARLLQVPRHKVLGYNAPPLLYSLGTVLAFLLLNIEIADFFTEPGRSALTFEFSGHLGRDMTYSIAWALFAFVLLVVGIRTRLSRVRYASLALLGFTLFKVFFHDLAHLARLYRVGALIGVAVVAMVASFLYQKFLSEDH